MMQTMISHLSTLLRVCVGVLVLTVIDCFPQGNGGSLFSEVFPGQCADLESQGLEGYECTPKSRCEDGYIVDSPIYGSLTPKQDYEYEHYDELDVSNYECPNVRQDYDYYDTSGDEMICCRKPEYFATGIEKILAYLYILILQYYV